MLTLLLTFTLLAPLQDTDTDAATADTSAADPKAVAMIEEFSSHLYDPAAEGLESLAFDVVVPGQMGMPPAGTIHVSWTSEGGSKVDFDPSEEIQEMVDSGMIPDVSMVSEAYTGLGEQLAETQTGGLIERLLQRSTPKMKGAEGAFIAIECTMKEGEPGGRSTLYFDADGMLQRMGGTTDAAGQQVEQMSTLVWKPAKGDAADEQLVLERMESEATIPGFGNVTQTQTFVREDVAGFPLVTTFEMSAMGQRQTFELSQFVVNGKPVGDAPAAGEGEGESSEEGEDGI